METTITIAQPISAPRVRPPRERPTPRALAVPRIARSLRLYEYDAERRRLWILGQRCHHGATGSLLAIFGAALMAHDWKDRTIWFKPGHGHQP